MKVLIIGGGISGLASASLMMQHGFDVTLIEATNRFGGLLKSISCEGEIYDIGSFLFPDGHPLFTLFPKLNGIMFKPDKVRQSNVIRNDYIDVYPFSISGLVRNTRLIDLAEIALDYFRVSGPEPTQSFRDWVVFHTGERFYRVSGLQRYVERCFGLPDTEVSLLFARQRMAHIASFRAGAMLGKSISRRPRKAKSTGTCPFLRPPSGFGEMIDCLENVLRSGGCELSKQEHLVSLRRTGQRFAVTTNRRENEYVDTVISTAPMGTVFEAMEIDSHKTLEYFGLLSLLCKGKLKCDADILFNSSDYGKWKRMTVFNRLYKEKSDIDRFTIEFVVSNEEGEQSLENAVDDFLVSSRKLGLVESGAECCGYEFTKNAYPKLTSRQDSEIERQRNLLSQLGIITIGRQGNYEYCSTKKCVTSAIDKTRQIIGSDAEQHSSVQHSP